MMHNIRDCSGLNEKIFQVIEKNVGKCLENSNVKNDANTIWKQNKIKKNLVQIDFELDQQSLENLFSALKLRVHKEQCGNLHTSCDKWQTQLKGWYLVNRTEGIYDECVKWKNYKVFESEHKSSNEMMLSDHSSKQSMDSNEMILELEKNYTTKSSSSVSSVPSLTNYMSVVDKLNNQHNHSNFSYEEEVSSHNVYKIKNCNYLSETLHKKEFQFKNNQINAMKGSFHFVKFVVRSSFQMPYVVKEFSTSKKNKKVQKKKINVLPHYKLNAMRDAWLYVTEEVMDVCIQKDICGKQIELKFQLVMSTQSKEQHDLDIYNCQNNRQFYLRLELDKEKYLLTKNHNICFLHCFCEYLKNLYNQPSNNQ